MSTARLSKMSVMQVIKKIRLYAISCRLECRRMTYSRTTFIAREAELLAVSTTWWIALTSKAKAKSLASIGNHGDEQSHRTMRNSSSSKP